MKIDFVSASSQMPPQPKRKKFWASLFSLLVLVVLIAASCFVWNGYFSPQAKSERETRENYQKYLSWKENYEKAMREDIYGGKTPEETLKMFIEALEKEDIEEAGKYFALNDNENSEYYLTRREWEEKLKKAREEKKIPEIINIISKAKLDNLSSSLETKWFVVKNNEGIVEYSIILEFDSFSKVWKIESL